MAAAALYVDTFLLDVRGGASRGAVAGAMEESAADGGARGVGACRGTEWNVGKWDCGCWAWILVYARGGADGQRRSGVGGEWEAWRRTNGASDCGGGADSIYPTSPDMDLDLFRT